MASSSRRSFLKASTAAVAAFAVSKPVSVWADAPGPVEMLGFGAALTDASCYVLSRLPGGEQLALLQELFAPGEMALNVCRTCIGASDYSQTVYSFDESAEPDPEMKKFSIDHDREYILPILSAARRINPGLFLFSSPWSPPGWMKSNGSMLGGAMRKDNLGPYAYYLMKFLAEYKAAGVPIDAITVQNEVDTDQDGRMPACLWGQEYEIGFVKSHLGPLFCQTIIDQGPELTDKRGINCAPARQDRLAETSDAQRILGIQQIQRGNIRVGSIAQSLAHRISKTGAAVLRWPG